MTVAFSCPSWCVDHNDGAVVSSDGCCLHFGPERCVDLGGPNWSDRPRRIGMRVLAQDRRNSRDYRIAITDPAGAAIELTRGTVYRLAHLLLRAADLRLAPVRQGCPTWCSGHGDLRAGEEARIVEHHGPLMVVRQSGGHEFPKAIELRLNRYDHQEGGAALLLELFMSDCDPGIELSGAQACKFAAHLLNSLDEIDAA